MGATSIGLTFSQMPVPGERKSGIPDGTDTPAPVRTNAERAPRIISARRVALSIRVPSAKAYLPLNCGVRLPRKAPMPSLASSDENAFSNPRASASRPSPSSPVADTVLICSIAKGAC